MQDKSSPASVERDPTLKGTPASGDVEKSAPLFSDTAPTKPIKPESDIVPWKILIVDDEEDVHAVTRLVLGRLNFEGRDVKIHSAYSGAEAKTFLRHNPDTAVILLDVVMETDNSGLEVVKYIRTDLDNHHVRIIINTGQPGNAPESHVIVDYEINDYHTKPELTHTRLLTTLITALRSYRDITHAEQNLKEKEVAEAAKRAQAQFLANMSHEIRTPMFGVIGMAEILQTTELNSDQRSYVDTIITSVDALLTIVNDILDFSKIESGNLELEFVSLDLRKTLTDIERLFGPKITKQRLKYQVKIAPNVPATIVSDPTRLRQILNNLVGNAIKFTSDGGITVTVETHQDDATKSEMLLFRIMDTGVGIPINELERLFKPFTQLDASTSRRFGGTGLGLTITKELIEKLGGAISVISEEGSGTTIEFSLPLLQMTTINPPTIHDPSNTATTEDFTKESQYVSKGRILLVEDNPINQRVTSVILDKLGFTITIANNGLEAVEIIKQEMFDLILMDCQMPEMDGFTATRTIRRVPQFKEIPIIAMTANVTPQDKQDCFDAGMNDFIGKPVRLSGISQMIQKWIKSRTTP